MNLKDIVDSVNLSKFETLFQKLERDFSNPENVDVELLIYKVGFNFIKAFKLEEYVKEIKFQETHEKNSDVRGVYSDNNVYIFRNGIEKSMENIEGLSEYEKKFIR